MAQSKGKGFRFRHSLPGVLGLIALAALPFSSRAEDPPPVSAESGRVTDQVDAPLILSPEELEEKIGGVPVEISWAGPPGVARYRCILARDRAFRNVVVNRIVRGAAAVKLEPLDYGTYFLKVCALGPDGSDSSCAERVSFIVVPDPTENAGHN